jgi:hypothetical protein
MERVNAMGEEAKGRQIVEICIFGAEMTCE